MDFQSEPKINPELRAELTIQSDADSQMREYIIYATLWGRTLMMQLNEAMQLQQSKRMGNIMLAVFDAETYVFSVYAVLHCWYCN